MSLVEDIQYRGTQHNDRMVPIKSGVSYGNFGRLESFWRVFLSETVTYHDGSTGRKIEDMEWLYFIPKISGDLL